MYSEHFEESTVGEVSLGHEFDLDGTRFMVFYTSEPLPLGMANCTVLRSKTLTSGTFHFISKKNLCKRLVRIYG